MEKYSWVWLIQVWLSVEKDTRKRKGCPRIARNPLIIKHPGNPFIRIGIILLIVPVGTDLYHPVVIKELRYFQLGEIVTKRRGDCRRRAWIVVDGMVVHAVD